MICTYAMGGSHILYQGTQLATYHDSKLHNVDKVYSALSWLVPCKDNRPVAIYCSEGEECARRGPFPHGGRGWPDTWETGSTEEFMIADFDGGSHKGLFSCMYVGLASVTLILKIIITNYMFWTISQPMMANVVIVFHKPIRLYMVNTLYMLILFAVWLVKS